ncbi:hypothetical protein QA601_17425 [Chitinispirillales bacterium ANBcel5]|uniref:hypothetical protein n=1 Tax=Cellulosispirillum alkaliphilum TaxID=3039283 RepID=UPI002A5694AF|nr:hypothetical protein [Chitinispirillales bacterium ANBcel5]
MKLRHLLPVAFIGFIIMVGCGPSTELVPFTYSSLDHTDQQPYTKVIEGVSVDQVKSRLVSIAQAKGMELLGDRSIRLENAPANGVMLFFWSDEDGASDVYDDSYTEVYETTASLQYSSKYYFELIPAEAKVTVRAVGVPIFNNRMSCPDFVKQNYEECEAETVITEKGTPLWLSLRTQWGYDVSGRYEKRTISEILREL